MYDLIILGGGPAGYNAAERAGHAGLKTLVIEERALGGVCLNDTCIGNEYINSAKLLNSADNELLNRLGRADVNLDAYCALAERLCRSLCKLLVYIRKNNACALAVKLLCDAKTKALSAAGDYRNLAAEATAGRGSYKDVFLCVLFSLYKSHNVFLSI